MEKANSVNSYNGWDDEDLSSPVLNP